MAEAAGLIVEAIEGDHAGGPFGPGAERAVAAGALGIVGRVSGTSDQIRLLLVEDVPQVSQYIRGLLNAQSQVKLLDVVSDGRQVPEFVREGHPDIVMIDALLQGKVSGLKVAASLRAEGLLDAHHHHDRAPEADRSRSRDGHRRGALDALQRLRLHEPAAVDHGPGPG